MLLARIAIIDELPSSKHWGCHSRMAQGLAMSMLFISSELWVVNKSTSRLGPAFVVECYEPGFFVDQSLKTSSDGECQLMEKGLEPPGGNRTLMAKPFWACGTLASTSAQ